MGIIQKAKEIFEPLTKYALIDRREYSRNMSDLSAIYKTWDQNYTNDNSRPSLPLPYLDTPTGSKIPLWQLSPTRIFDMSKEIGDLRIVFETIQREMFRNGWEIRPKYKYKCPVCFKTFKDKPMSKFIPLEQQASNKDKEDGLECDQCGNTKDFIKPDPKNRVKLQSFMAVPANNNNQTVLEVGRMWERDADVIDNAYTLASKVYYLKPVEKGDLSGAKLEIDPDRTEISEFIPMHPISITMIANSEGRLGYDNSNKPVWICPNYLHRSKRLESPFCDTCGCKAINGCFESNNVPYGLPVSDPKKMVYGKDEVIWIAGKFMPDLLYGYSPILSIWKKAMSLYHQDEYIWKYFDKDRPPKSLLIFGSRNYESVSAFMDRQKQGAKSDPYMPRPILVNSENANQAASFIDLTPNFKELELTELRKELRQVILTIYGITPVYSGEQKGSGLGNEGLQLTLTNRAIKWYQSIFNEKFFDQITTRMFGIDDWEIALIDSEEIDELRTEQVRGQKITNAQMMYSMGFEVHTDGNGEIQVSQYPNPEKEAMMGGVGDNVKQGNSDKVKSTKPAGEDKTNFGGEHLQNRPSDTAGAAEGSVDSGFSHSKKSLGEFGPVVEIINKGITNNWTLTNMAKKISKANGWSEEESMDTIKWLISANLAKTTLGIKQPQKYTINKKENGETEVIRE